VLTQEFTKRIVSIPIGKHLNRLVWNEPSTGQDNSFCQYLRKWVSNPMGSTRPCNCHMPCRCYFGESLGRCLLHGWDVKSPQLSSWMVLTSRRALLRGSGSSPSSLTTTSLCDGGPERSRHLRPPAVECPELNSTRKHWQSRQAKKGG
jgi:hypothetical protein